MKSDQITKTNHHESPVAMALRRVSAKCWLDFRWTPWRFRIRCHVYPFEPVSGVSGATEEFGDFSLIKRTVGGLNGKNMYIIAYNIYIYMCVVFSWENHGHGIFEPWLRDPEGERCKSHETCWFPWVQRQTLVVVLDFNIQKWWLHVPTRMWNLLLIFWLTSRISLIHVSGNPLLCMEWRETYRNKTLGVDHKHGPNNSHRIGEAKIYQNSLFVGQNQGLSRSPA